jgi:hypothetical protein
MLLSDFVEDDCDETLLPIKREGYWRNRRRNNGIYIDDGHVDNPRDYHARIYGNNQSKNHGDNQRGNQGVNQGVNQGANQGVNQGVNQGGNEGVNQSANHGGNQRLNHGDNQRENPGYDARNGGSDMDEDDRIVEHWNMDGLDRVHRIMVADLISDRAIRQRTSDYGYLFPPMYLTHLPGMNSGFLEEYKMDARCFATETESDRVMRFVWNHVEYHSMKSIAISKIRAAIMEFGYAKTRLNFNVTDFVKMICLKYGIPFRIQVLDSMMGKRRRQLRGFWIVGMQKGQSRKTRKMRDLHEGTGTTMDPLVWQDNESQLPSDHVEIVDHEYDENEHGNEHDSDM